MKRFGVDLGEVACYQNLAAATARAAQGKRSRSDVRLFCADLDRNLAKLREDLLTGVAPYGIFRSFTIHDPKKRLIHAACFADRVIHHALMHVAGPVLDRALCPSTFACRPGMGPLAGVHWVQRQAGRHPWFVKIDIQKYFDSIDHGILLGLLARKFKGAGVIALFSRIIGHHAVKPGKGLPIGALTSQYFANFFLDGLDRFLLEDLKVRGHARYMDDSVWWCGSKTEARNTLAQVREWLCEKRRLEIKPDIQLNRSRLGIRFCGFRIQPGCLLLSERRRKRYRAKRLELEQAYLAGRIDDRTLQMRFAAIFGSVVHADSLGWRKLELRLSPSSVQEVLEG